MIELTDDDIEIIDPTTSGAGAYSDPKWSVYLSKQIWDLTEEQAKQLKQHILDDYEKARRFEYIIKELESKKKEPNMEQDEDRDRAIWISNLEYLLEESKKFVRWSYISLSWHIQVLLTKNFLLQNLL